MDYYLINPFYLLFLNLNYLENLLKLEKLVDF